MNTSSRSALDPAAEGAFLPLGRGGRILDHVPLHPGGGSQMEDRWRDGKKKRGLIRGARVLVFRCKKPVIGFAHRTMKLHPQTYKTSAF